MSFNRVLYLVSNAPKIFKLILELWRILRTGTDEELTEYFNSVENITYALKNSKTDKERADIALAISSIISKL
jgi:hypothetical protein